MTKFRIVLQNQIIEFTTEAAAQDYKLANNLDVEVESFEEILPVAPVDFAAIVKSAIDEGTKLIIDFAAENVSMGITQAGKTKAIADYLADVMRYAQSGSLYEVLAEVNRLQELGLPDDLAPFVTNDRLNTFKYKIETYLGL